MGSQTVDGARRGQPDGARRGQPDEDSARRGQPDVDGARRGQPDVAVASWAARKKMWRWRRGQPGRINAQPLGCPVHRKASSDTIVTGAFGHHKISRQLGGVKGAGELVKAMTKASRWAS